MNWGYASNDSSEYLYRITRSLLTLWEYAFVTSWQKTIILAYFNIFINGRGRRIEQSMRSVLSLIVVAYPCTECLSANVCKALRKRAQCHITNPSTKNIFTASAHFRTWCSTWCFALWTVMEVTASLSWKSISLHLTTANALFYALDNGL